MTFKQLGLRAEVLRALESEGYTHPTPIQLQAIPAVLAGHDVLAGAQTGTGKTAAFAAPLLHLLSQQERATRSPHPQALILAPTRELASQIGESFRTYGRGLGLRSAVIFGGMSLGPQITTLRRGIDILVATPGRLLDHANKGAVDLSQVKFLVLDEADRMLDMGFIHDIRRVIKLLPAKRQSMLFSATYNDEIRQLAPSILRNPRVIEVARRSSAAEAVTQVVHPVPQSRKRDLLAHLMHDGDWRQVLVFTRTKHGANRLARQLDTDGITALAIHGNKSQAARTRALADFKAGRIRALVATDVASRGLDIDLLPHVVNYEIPNVPEDYVHRIGRTGRAGAGGTAVSLVAPEEREFLRDIQKLLGRSIGVREIPGFDQPAPREAAEPIARPTGRTSGRPGVRSAARPADRPTNRAGAQPSRERRRTEAATPARTSRSAGRGTAEAAPRQRHAHTEEAIPPYVRRSRRSAN